MQEKCPQCENHCAKEELKCPEGRKYFGLPVEKKEAGGRGPGKEPETLDEKVIVMLRKCGHYLHHNAGHGEAAARIAPPESMSDVEKIALCSLLEKCMQGWQKD